MNRTSYVGLILLVLAGFLACAPGDQPQLRQTAEERQILALIDVWATKDFDQIDSIFTADGVYEDVPDQASYRGRDEIKDWLQEIVTWAPDTKVELTSLFVSGDRGAATWIWSGTQTGEIRDLIVATGRPFSVSGVSIYEFREGMISKNSDYYDAGRFLAQLGVTFNFPASEEVE